MPDALKLKDKDTISKKIIYAVYDIIHEEGFDNLTMRKVAQKSGCSNTAIYMRFPDKNALLMEIARQTEAIFQDVLLQEYQEEKNFLVNLQHIMSCFLEKYATLQWEVVELHLYYLMKDNPDKSVVFQKVLQLIQKAVQEREIKNADPLVLTKLLITNFTGLVFCSCARQERDLEDAKVGLKYQLESLFRGFDMKSEEERFWDSLQECGVNLEAALKRMKGNKKTYKLFLQEFFEDSDFEDLRTSLEESQVECAFEYAHGLKGIAANLGLDNVYAPLSELVEILRAGSMDGAQDRYKEVCRACDQIKMLLK